MPDIPANFTEFRVLAPGVWAEVHGGCGGPERESAAEAPGAQLRLEGRENLHQPLALGLTEPFYPVFTHANLAKSSEI